MSEGSEFDDLIFELSRVVTDTSGAALSVAVE